jgi:hypothetical protein
LFGKFFWLHIWEFRINPDLVNLDSRWDHDKLGGVEFWNLALRGIQNQCDCMLSASAHHKDLPFLEHLGVEDGWFENTVVISGAKDIVFSHAPSKNF